MKLNPEFILQPMGEESVLVPVGKAGEKFRGMIRLNETAAYIVEQLKTETTEPRIVDALLIEYEVERETAEKNVAAVLEKLRSVGALIE